ncbi:MAG: NAD(P)-dependent oxidoreductase [Victivallales bacterium]|nr:NAD(P)-dependent oxidoreductase [Victivallales bacterium]
MTAKPKVLITGAGGYIGSNAVEYFMRQGCDVIGMIHNHVSERFANSGAGAVRADLCDCASLKELFTVNYDYVIHIAARASDVGRDALFRLANFEAVKHLAALAMEHKVKRFVFLSSSDVYGLHDFHGETEDHLEFDHAVKNPYPKYKIKSDQWLKTHLPPEYFSCVRPCVVWGNGDTTITPRAVAFLKSSPLVFHFGSWRGQNRWPLAHVENVCKTLYAAMLLPQAAGQGVTVLDSEFTTLSQFYHRLAAKHLPDKVIREISLPCWTIRPAAWCSTVLATMLNRHSPLFDPSLYALQTITHNLDFSNARMLEWISKI